LLQEVETLSSGLLNPHRARLLNRIGKYPERNPSPVREKIGAYLLGGFDPFGTGLEASNPPVSP